MDPASASRDENEALAATSGGPARSRPIMRRTLVLLTVTVLTVAALAGPAHAAIELGVQDDPLLVRLPTAFGGLGAARLLPPKRVWAALNTLRVDTVRINVPWARVAGRHPEDPLDLYLYDVAVDRVRA